MPKDKPPRRTLPNSTFRVPDKAALERKKKKQLQRARETARSLRQNKQGRKTLKKANPERQAKRRKSYAQKLAAYKRSETYKLVETRAGGRCERYEDCHDFDGSVLGRWLRCTRMRETGDRLTHHHKTYARFGGKELPEDVELLCDPHNEHAESQHPTRNRNYRKTAA